MEKEIKYSQERLWAAEGSRGGGLRSETWLWAHLGVILTLTECQLPCVGGLNRLMSCLPLPHVQHSESGKTLLLRLTLFCSPLSFPPLSPPLIFSFPVSHRLGTSGPKEALIVCLPDSSFHLRNILQAKSNRCRTAGLPGGAHLPVLASRALSA